MLSTGSPTGRVVMFQLCHISHLGSMYSQASVNPEVAEGRAQLPVIESLEKRGSGSREGRLTSLRQWQSPRGPPAGTAPGLDCAELNGPNPPGGRREKVKLCELTGISKTRTTPFHPQCDGQPERMNRTLLQMLRCTADENSASWHKKLPTVTSAYRIMVHKVTGLTPNMAMFGREVMLPTSLVAKPPDEPVTSSVPFVVDLRDALRNAHDRVRRATKRAARVQRKYYDEKSRQTEFREGQMVWLFWPQPHVRQRFKKLRKLWMGPRKIKEFQSLLVMKIWHVKKKMEQTVHIDRLLPCLTLQAVDQPIEDSLPTCLGKGSSRHPLNHL